LEDSKIRASGDVEIHGIVEAADIEVKGNLYVRGGIGGKERVSIRVGGEVHAMYIRDCVVEAGGGHCRSPRGGSLGCKDPGDGACS